MAGCAMDRRNTSKGSVIGRERVSPSITPPWNGPPLLPGKPLETAYPDLESADLQPLVGMARQFAEELERLLDRSYFTIQEKR